MESNESKLIECLYCGGKTRTKIDKDTILIHFPLYCPKCKREMKINVKQMKVSVVQASDCNYSDKKWYR